MSAATASFGFGGEEDHEDYKDLKATAVAESEGGAKGPEDVQGRGLGYQKQAS